MGAVSEGHGTRGTHQSAGGAHAQIQRLLGVAQREQHRGHGRDRGRAQRKHAHRQAIPQGGRGNGRLDSQPVRQGGRDRNGRRRMVQLRRGCEGDTSGAQGRVGRILQGGRQAAGSGDIRNAAGRAHHEPVGAAAADGQPYQADNTFQSTAAQNSQSAGNCL